MGSRTQFSVAVLGLVAATGVWAFAEAQKVERRRMEYDYWRGEGDLIRIIEAPLDDRLAELCRRFAQSDPQTRAGMRSAMSTDEFYALLTFSRRSALLAMREQSAARVTDGLTAIAIIDSERIDFRDALVSLALLHHAAVRLGQDPAGLFQNAAALAEKRMALLISGFPRRPQPEKDIRQSWGYAEVKTEAGLGLIGWRFRPYNPTFPMERIVMDLAEVIEADKYRAGSIDIAGELPPVWLSGVDDPALKRALNSVRAVAIIHGDLRPAEHPTYTRQQFTIFLAETTDDAAAGTLLRLSRGKKPAGDNCLLGLADGRLFCLIVARSFVNGVPSFETPESLRRFAPGIAGVLKRYAE